MTLPKSRFQILVSSIVAPVDGSGTGCPANLVSTTSLYFNKSVLLSNLSPLNLERGTRYSYTFS